MMVDPLAINVSGYYDPTAYKAIRKLLKSEEKKMDIYNGDIFEVELNNGVHREVVVLSVHDTYSTVLMLCNNETMPYGVNCLGMKYTEPGMVQYMYHDKFKSFIRSMKDDEFSDLMQAVVDALGYDALVAKPEKVDEKIVLEPDTTNTGVEWFSEELAQAMDERNVYKELYDNLISSMLAK